MLDPSRISSASLIGKMLRLPLRLIPPTAIVPILTGPLRGKKWIVGSDVHGAWLGTYEADKVSLFREAVFPDCVVFDIGAHVGVYSLVAAQRAGSVIAFEPLPRNISYFERHMALNSIVNVKLVKAAVSNSAGVARFDDAGAHKEGRVSGEGKLDVQTVGIDELVEAGCIPSPDLIKMDVEGGEAAALAGMRHVLRDARPTLFLATHNGLNRLCFQFLEDLDYIIQPIDGKSREATSEIVAIPLAQRIHHQ